MLQKGLVIQPRVLATPVVAVPLLGLAVGGPLLGPVVGVQQGLAVGVPLGLAVAVELGLAVGVELAEVAFLVGHPNRMAMVVETLATRTAQVAMDNRVVVSTSQGVASTSSLHPSRQVPEVMVRIKVTLATSRTKP